jgi:hypothetical protein
MNQPKEDSIILTEMYYNQIYYSQFTYACKLIRSDAKIVLICWENSFKYVMILDFRQSSIYQTLINSVIIVLKDNNITESFRAKKFIYINR